MAQQKADGQQRVRPMPTDANEQGALAWTRRSGRYMGQTKSRDMPFEVPKHSRNLVFRFISRAYRFPTPDLSPIGCSIRCFRQAVLGKLCESSDFSSIPYHTSRHSSTLTEHWRFVTQCYAVYHTTPSAQRVFNITHETLMTFNASASSLR